MPDFYTLYLIVLIAGLSHCVLWAGHPLSLQDAAGGALLAGGQHGSCGGRHPARHRWRRREFRHHRRRECRRLSGLSPEYGRPAPLPRGQAALGSPCRAACRQHPGHGPHLAALVGPEPTLRHVAMHSSRARNSLSRPAPDTGARRTHHDERTGVGHHGPWHRRLRGDGEAQRHRAGCLPGLPRGHRPAGLHPGGHHLEFRLHRLGGRQPDGESGAARRRGRPDRPAQSPPVHAAAHRGMRAQDGRAVQRDADGSRPVQGDQ